MPKAQPLVTHSPGPWTVATSGVSVDAGAIRIRQEAGGSRDERAANAKLIAAAPALLDACQAALEHVEGAFFESHPELVEQLRYAVWKAVR